MLSAIDGKSKAMYLVYGDEVFHRSGPPEYMSATALTRLIHRDSYKNKLMDKIQKNMMVPDKPKEAGKEVLRYTHFSNILECEYIRGWALKRLGCSDSTVIEQNEYITLRCSDSTVFDHNVYYITKQQQYSRKFECTRRRIERGFSGFLIVAEGVELVCDFGRIFQKIVRPYVDNYDNTLDEALNTFVSYYEQNEMFDLYTHGTGPGLVGVVINMLKTFLGRCVNTKLDKNLPADLNTQLSIDVYVNKLKKIVNKVVYDPAECDEAAGKLTKVEETVKPSKDRKKKKANIKYTDRKTSSKPSTATVSSDKGSDDSEAEILLSGEEQFSTLTSYDGQKQYRPPDPTKTDAKFGAKKKNPMKSLADELSKVSKKMSEYQAEINRLTKCLASQKRKLATVAAGKDSAATATEDAPKKLKVAKEGRVGEKSLQRYDEWAVSSKKAFDPSLKGFVSSQLREDLESNDDIQVIDNPDSTTAGAGKKHRKRDRDSDEESDDTSLILGRSQVQPMRRRRRISSEKSSVAEDVQPSSSQQRGDTEESEGEPEEVDGLLRKRDQVAVELQQMKLKVEGMEWENRARRYHETIQKCVGIFRKALINNFGNREESDHLKEVRGDMVRCTRTLAKNGFTLRVCEDFIERVEKTVQSGEIPEQKMEMTKTDDSVDNLVVGFARDVTYVLTIPPVVKQEKGENEDDDDELMIVGVTPATMDPPLIKEVKKEVPSPPPSPNRGAGMKEVSEDGSSSQKTPEEAQEENVVGKVPAAEKPEEAESPDKEGEGTSSNRTPQKKQVMARATENTNTDSEKVTSPEKSTEGDASKGKKSRKTLGTHVSKRVLRSKKTK